MIRIESLEDLKNRIRREIADANEFGEYFLAGEWETLLAELDAGAHPVDIKLDMEHAHRDGCDSYSDEVEATFRRWASYVK